MFQNPPLLCDIDLYLCQAQFEAQNPLKCQTLRVYYIQTDYKFNYYLCHQEIYHLYLAKYSQLQTVSGVTFILLNAHQKPVVFFLTCLYLYNKNKAYSVFRISFNQIDCYSEILDLAHVYDLTWIQSLYHRVVNNKVATVVNGLLYRVGNQIMCLDSASHTIFTVGAPRHMRAFVASADGLSWYAVSAPRPCFIQLWSKRRDHNEWTLVTVKTLDEAIFSFEVALIQGVYLYILQNRRRLECYDLSTHTWHQVTPPLPASTTYAMAGTNNDTLPLILAANSLDRRLYVCARVLGGVGGDYHRVTPLLLPPDAPQATVAALNNRGARRFYSSLVRQRHPRQDWFLTAIKADIEDKLSPARLSSPLSSLKPPLPQPPLSQGGALKSVPELIKRICATGRSFQGVVSKEARVKSNVGFNGQPCEPSKEWDKLLVVWPVVYGRQNNGSWWKNILTRPDCPRWSRVHPGHDWFDFVWDPTASQLYTVKMTSQDGAVSSIDVDGKAVRVNFFNPNYTDASFVTVVDRETESVAYAGVKGGLESLAHCRVSVNTNHTLTLFPTMLGDPVPPALSHFVSQLSVELSRRLTGATGDRDLTYFNGGVRYLPDNDNVTGNVRLELYVTDPPSSHVVFKTNLEAFLERYVPRNPRPKLLGVGSMCHTDSNSDYTRLSYNI
ncbi:protein ORF118 [Lake sturgeon herpesvirus]|nr:protein ORF118 [Lake sturgeon herpesvirus]